MNENENAELRKEISRQNQIIAGLLKLNEVLENEITYLRKGIGHSEAEISDANKWIGNRGNTISNPNFMIGNTGDAISNQKTGIGNSMHTMPNEKAEIGNSNASTGIPVSIPIERSNIWGLARKLKAVGFSNVKNAGLNSVAILLLHFYNKGRGDYATLRKLTGLSSGGLGKNIMALKKRGAITRTAYQEFTVSASLSQLIQTTFQH